MDNNCDGKTDNIFWSHVFPIKSSVDYSSHTGQLSIDTQGNIYALLNSNGQLTVGSQMAASEENSTIAKLDQEGGILWTAQISAAQGVTLASGGLAVDSKGYVYVSGYADGKLTFAPKTALLGGTQDLTGKSIFLSYIEPQGKFEAPVLRMGSGLSLEGAGGFLAVDDNDNVFHGRTFTGTIEVTTPDGTKKSATSTQAAGFVAKYTSRYSSIQWMHKMSASTGLFLGPFLATTPHGSSNLFASASFKGSLSYDKPLKSISSRGELELVIKKINTSDGSIDWVIPIGAINTVAFGTLSKTTSDPMVYGFVRAKANTAGIKTLGFPGPNGTTLTLQVSDQTKLQSFIGMLDIKSQPPHFKWINTIATPDGKNITIQGLAQKPGGIAAAIVDFDAADFQVGSNPVKSTKPSTLVALIDNTTGAFTKVFVATSTGAEPVRSDGIVYDKRRDVFHILGSFTTDVTIGGKTLTHPATHQRAFFLLNVKPDGTWSCPP